LGGLIIVRLRAKMTLLSDSVHYVVYGERLESGRGAEIVLGLPVVTRWSLFTGRETL